MTRISTIAATLGFILLTSSAALAMALETAAPPCNPSRVGWTMPADGDVEVPRNARVVLSVTLGWCFGPPTYRLLRDGVDEVETTLVEWNGHVALEPVEALDANTDYVIELDEPEMGTQEFAFRTAEVSVEAELAAPTFDSLEAFIDSSQTNAPNGIVQLQLSVDTHEGGPWRLLHVGLDRGDEIEDDEATYTTTIQAWADAPTFITLDEWADDLTEVCVLVAQQDVTGRWSEATRECAEPVAVEGLYPVMEMSDMEGGFFPFPPLPGCRAGGNGLGAGWLGLLALLGLVMVRRRG